MDVGVLLCRANIWRTRSNFANPYFLIFFINYGQLLVKFSARSEHFFFRGSKGLNQCGSDTLLVPQQQVCLLSCTGYIMYSIA
jgi:hypothetical protein